MHILFIRKFQQRMFLASMKEKKESPEEEGEACQREAFQSLHTDQSNRAPTIRYCGHFFYCMNFSLHYCKSFSLVILFYGMIFSLYFGKNISIHWILSLILYRCHHVMPASTCPPDQVLIDQNPRARSCLFR